MRRALLPSGLGMKLRRRLAGGSGAVEALRATWSRYPGEWERDEALSMGASDSRFLRDIGIRSYGLSPNFGTRPEARAGHVAHGPDERRPEKWLLTGAKYLRDIVRTLAL